MPIYAGIDVGAQSVKASLYNGEQCLGVRKMVTEEEAGRAARRVYEDLLADLDLSAGSVERILVTGGGAEEVSFAHGRSSEQICGARGARFLIPTARMVVDLGAEGCRVMKLDEKGVLSDFSNNSKCASGTGAFIELGAVYLKVSLSDMGRLSLAADGAADLSSTCAVFAESIIISNIHSGESRERIAAGIHKAAATRITELIGRLGLVEDLVLIGGAALNTGLVRMIETINGVPVKIPDNPGTVVALGAAIQASLKKAGRRNRRAASIG
ncbi:MAG: 2-hydroxyglutaryl-CoA dehydratase [Deltaproteobacteria bacterium]|nr:2-hydroxyglutaryl-CoA dehydratase [Deltaproteobacteria bacterium]